MGLYPCIPLPFFSNPLKTFEKERLGIEHLHDNTEWIRQNRFVLQMVGNEQQRCPEGDWTPWQSHYVECLSNSTFDEGLLMCKSEKQAMEWLIARA